MKAKVLGIQQVNYTSKKTGQPVLGTTLHCSLKDANVFGEAVDNIFISDNLGLKSVIDNITVGTLVNVEYNNRGYINDLTVISQPALAASPEAKTNMASPETKANTK